MWQWGWGPSSNLVSVGFLCFKSCYIVKQLMQWAQCVARWSCFSYLSTQVEWGGRKSVKFEVISFLVLLWCGCQLYDHLCHKSISHLVHAHKCLWILVFTNRRILVCVLIQTCFLGNWNAVLLTFISQSSVDTQICTALGKVEILPQFTL